MFRNGSTLTLLVLSAMFLATVWTESLSNTLLSGTDCNWNKRISLICYECGRLHFENFHSIHNACCSGLDTEMREYCEAVYTESPRQ